jgi:foldase protein PrsA
MCEVPVTPGELGRRPLRLRYDRRIVNRVLGLFPALGAFFVASLLVAGCGDSIPGNAVASVDGTAISKTEFTHWLGIAAATNQTGAAKVAYTPPTFTACVAGKRKTAPTPAKGQPATTDAQLKAQCKQEYETLRDQVLQFLIVEQWVNKETKKQNVTISDKTAEAAVQKAIKQSFPKDADFQKFLKTSGMTIGDVRRQVRWSSLYAKLRAEAVKRAKKVTDKDVQAFYNKNKARLGTPLTRDLRLVLTRDKATADKARSALQGGASWSSVVKKYSIDTATKANGGVLSGLSRGQQEKTFENAIFSAPKGKLQGPVKTQFGYYVFQVQKETPATQQTLKQAGPAIRQQLDAQNKQKADDDFNTELRKTWKARTNCRDGYVMTQCKNAPKETTTAAAAGGTQTPQTQTPQTQTPQTQQPPPPPTTQQP